MIDSVFLDMDGVLVDFVSSALFVHQQQVNPDSQVDKPVFDAELCLHEWPAGEWDIVNVLGSDADEFWEMIHTWREGAFWSSLSPYPWAKQLVDAAKKLGAVRLLTSPADHATSYSGKKATADCHFGDVPLHMCGEKYLVSAPGRLLIDDNDKNVEQWREAGGPAILFPQIWNKNHEWKDSPMVYVGMEMEKLRAAPAA